MSVWEVCWKSEALRDLERLDASKARRVLAQVRRVALNPRPRSQGGYGKPLGNKGGLDLVGLCEVKLRGDGIRVIYGLEEREGKMVVVVVGLRSDNEVYRLAARRMRRR